MPRLRVRPEAEVDAFEAAVWYERERPGLGVEYLEAIGAAFQRIEEAPRQFPAVFHDIRRAILHRFPFGVFFTLDDDVVTVVAVTHLHRHPSAWVRRR
jgi:plasmid stabilization system protein ParE